MRSIGQRKRAGVRPFEFLLSIELLVFNDVFYRFHLDICLGKQILNTLSVRRTPAADRLAVLFVDICFVHADIASSGSSDYCLSCRSDFVFGHFGKRNEVFWHNHLLLNYTICCADVKGILLLLLYLNNHMCIKFEIRSAKF